jgi:hypothetical protein
MTKIRINSGHLGGIERLLTAKEWERAAIVWAFTTNDDVGGRPRKGHETSTRFPVSISQFARLGLAGLTKPETIRRYRNAWQDAIDRGKAQPVRPGDDNIEIPDLPWPPSRRYERTTT